MLLPLPQLRSASIVAARACPPEAAEKRVVAGARRERSCTTKSCRLQHHSTSAASPLSAKRGPKIKLPPSRHTLQTILTRSTRTTHPPPPPLDDQPPALRAHARPSQTRAPRQENHPSPPARRNRAPNRPKLVRSARSITSSTSSLKCSDWGDAKMRTGSDTREPDDSPCRVGR